MKNLLLVHKVVPILFCLMLPPRKQRIDKLLLEWALDFPCSSDRNRRRIFFFLTIWRHWRMCCAVVAFFELHIKGSLKHHPNLFYQAFVISNVYFFPGAHCAFITVEWEAKQRHASQRSLWYPFAKRTKSCFFILPPRSSTAFPPCAPIYLRISGTAKAIKSGKQRGHLHWLLPVWLHAYV